MIKTMENEKLTERDYEDAMHSQSACNLSGIVHSLSRVMPKIWIEAGEKGEGTDYVNQHPIVRLYAEQIMHLSGKREYSDAHKAVSEKLEKAQV